MNPNYRRTRHARELMAATPGLKYTEALRLADEHHARDETNASIDSAVILWNAQHYLGPLTFLMGPSLDDPTETARITLDGPTSHYLITGATGAGKTQLADILIAQAATKEMAWGQGIFARTHVIDPMGPLAERWRDRPNVEVTNGARPQELDGHTITGTEAMALHLDAICQAMRDRTILLAEHDAPTWQQLPEDIKIEHQVAPVFIVADEVWTFVPEQGDGPAVAAENQARLRARIGMGLIARSGRESGFHLIVIGQSPEGPHLDDTIARGLGGRIVLGAMTPRATRFMFGSAIAKTLAQEDASPRRPTLGLAHFGHEGGDEVDTAQTYLLTPEELDRRLPRQPRTE